MRTRTEYSIVDNTIVIIDKELTIEDIRLIINETQRIVICSSMQKSNVSVSTSDGNTIISVPTTLCVLQAADKITVEYDDCVLPATLSNQQVIMQGFNFSQPLKEMIPLTDEEIEDKYIVIADTTYGHSVPVEVKIDNINFTMYQERFYSDYGYSVLYRNGVEIDTTITHPSEGDILTTTNE